MHPFLNRIFRFSENRTTLRTEIVAGVTTFLTMSYIVVVNPAILQSAGIPAGPSTVATILTAIFGTLLMGLYANRPFAVAPYMGENAFIAFTVVRALGFSWQQALAAIFLAGGIFLLLTVLRLRQWLVDAVPHVLRFSFGIGIGLFLTFVGLNETGIVLGGAGGAPLKTGVLNSPPVLLSIFGFLLIAILVIRKVTGAILIGILATSVLGMVAHIVPLPHGYVSLPPSVTPIVWKLDFSHVFSGAFLPVVLTIFVMAFVDTMGSLIGVSARAGLLDKDGHLPQIERPMLVDALATMFGATLGTTTSGAFIESATGIEAGGRTGFASIITAACFAVTLFFAPVVAAIPPQAYGPALIIVGLLMVTPIAQNVFKDLSDSIPAFAVVALMSFTYNVGIGIAGGLVLYPLCKLAAGKRQEIKPGLWLLAAIALLFFVFYPYR